MTGPSQRLTLGLEKRIAVAGSSAAQDIGHGSVHGRGYCEQMTVARPGTYDIDVLRGLAGPRRKVEPYLGSIAEANTGQISALCEHLSVLERDLPCLHLTYLRTGRSLILSQAELPGTTSTRHARRSWPIFSHHCARSTRRARSRAPTICRNFVINRRGWNST